MKKIILSLFLLVSFAESQTLIKLKQLENSGGTGSVVVTNTAGVLTYTPKLPASAIPTLATYVPYNGAIQDLNMSPSNAVYAKNFNVTGSSGSGYVNFGQQNFLALAPGSGFNLYSGPGHTFDWININGINSNFNTLANTTDNTYTLPDASGQVALTSDLTFSNNVWNKDGNAITTNTNFIGTTTNRSLYLGANGLPKQLIVDSLGAVYSQGVTNKTRDNIYYGRGCGTFTTNGIETAVFGLNSAPTQTSGNGNSYFGTYTARAFKSGGQNCVFGSDAISNNISGSSNIVMGVQAAASFTGSTIHTFGTRSFQNLISGSNNIGMGILCAQGFTLGSNNIFLSCNSASLNTGNFNTIIGNNFISPSTTLNNNIILADGAGNTRYRWNGNQNIFLANSGTTTATFSTSLNSLSLFQDATNNWLYAPDGTHLVFSADGGSAQQYQIDNNTQSWFTQPATAPTGNGFIYQWSASAHTGQTAGVEHNSFVYNTAATQYSTGALPRHRFFKLRQNSVSFVGPSILTDAALVYIESAPIAGANATITNSSGLLISGMTGTVSVGAGVVNGYGLSCYATQGAANNYSARFLGGNVGIGTSSPQTLLHVAGNLTAGNFTFNTTMSYTNELLTFSSTQPNGGSYNIPADPVISMARTTNSTTALNSHCFTDGTLFLKNTNGLANNAYNDYGKILGSVDYDHHASFQSGFEFAGTGTTSDYYGLIDAPSISSGTLTHRHGSRINDIVGAGTVTENYGYYVAPLAKGTASNYAFYSASAQSFFGGRTTIRGGLDLWNISTTSGTTNDITFRHGGSATLTGAIKEELQSGYNKYHFIVGRLPSWTQFTMCTMDGNTNAMTVNLSRFEEAQGADVASATGSIVLGSDGNVFEITGTSTITSIEGINWKNGSEVTLLFTSTASLTDGVANSGTIVGFELNGNVDFIGTTGASVTIILSEIGGVQRWREKCRSVN